jgi:hypothetical protein
MASIETEELPSAAPVAAEPRPLNDHGDHNPLGLHVDEMFAR